MSEETIYSDYMLWDQERLDFWNSLPDFVPNLGIMISK